MTRRFSRAGLAAAMLAWAGAAAGAPSNLSSHGAAFFERLLAGRVWLYERPHSAHAGDRGMVWGAYYRPDGTVLACVHLEGAYTAAEDRWRIVPSPRFRALHNYYKAGTEPDPGHVRGHVPIFYDPESGRLHTESLSVERGQWFVLSLGWVQERWPRALKDACPGLGLPADLPIEERQTSVRMEEAIAQVPEAAVRGFPGSALRAPGSTGRALAGGGPTMTAQALGRFLAGNDGQVLESPAGTRLVLVLHPETDELWRLDGRGDVADVGYLLPAAGGAAIAVQWERLPRTQLYRIGDPFPLRPTGERYAAMRLMDWMTARGRTVELPFMERERVALRFEAGGAVTAPAEGGGEIGGRWWWSRGRLHVALDGFAETAGYAWRALADRLRWPPAGEGGGSGAARP